MNPKKCLYLVGMPGCGKSTLGKKYATFSGFSFADTDEIIIREQKKSIEKIYEEGGEIGFRKLEHELIQRFANTYETVVCTGGGLPCFFGNMEIMNLQGITVYMDVSPEEIWQRVKDTDFSGRPIYQNKTALEIQDIITKTSLERSKIYSKATIILKSNRIDLDDLLKALKELKIY